MKKTSSTESPADWRLLRGFDETLSKLDRLFREDRVPQALMFVGPEGIGKGLLALKLAALFYCDEGRGCGECPACLDLLRDEHPECLVLNGSAALKVEHVGQLQEHLAIQSALPLAGCPGRLQPRLVIMTDVDRLNRQASNRMLKILEEPPAATIILMTSSKPKALLPTFLSRVVAWQLQPPSRDETLDILGSQLDEFNLAPADLERLLQECAYAPGQLLKSLRARSQDEQQLVNRLLRDLVFAEGSLVAMDAAKQLVKELQLDANDLAKGIELLLNQYYRWSLSKDSSGDAYFARVGPRLDPATLVRWRTALSRMRHFAGKGVPLNAQMLAETFALTR